MNLLINYTHAFVILHTDFLKMKLIGSLFMEDLSIFFTYLNLTQHTSVMDLCEHKKAQSLSQVIVRFHLIK